MASHGEAGGQQRAGYVTPERPGTAGAEPDSPAGMRSRVGAMNIPVVDNSEHYNHEELAQQVRVLKAQMRVVGTATEDVLAKHNVSVGDVEQGMNGLMATSGQQFADMARLKDGCQVIEGEVRALHGACAGSQLHNEQVEHAFVVFRTEYGDKLGLIAEGAKTSEQ